MTSHREEQPLILPAGADPEQRDASLHGQAVSRSRYEPDRNVSDICPLDPRFVDAPDERLEEPDPFHVHEPLIEPLERLRGRRVIRRLDEGLENRCCRLLG